MPKKRTTRARQVSKPPVKSVNAKTMTEVALNEKRDQLNILLAEVDTKLASTLKNMERNYKKFELTIRRTFRDGISKIPAKQRTMTLREYAMTYGKEDAAVAPMSTVSEKTKKSKMLAEIQNFVWDPSAEALDVIEEEGHNETAAMSKAKPAPPSTAKPTRGKKGKSVTQPPPSSSRSTRSKFATPLSRTGQDQWGQTPLFTPKFDPKLPVTPATVRDSKEGELLISAAGSPVIPSRRRAFGALDPAKISECTEKIEQEMGVPCPEDKFNRILGLITATLNHY